MTSENKTLQPSIDSIKPGRALRDCVRRALHVRCARLQAVVAAAGIASVTPLALGAAFPPVFPLASLYPAGGGDGSRGFVLPGIDADDRSGFPVSAAGDLNGDGIEDVIIGARRADPGGHSKAGESYVVFGSRQWSQAVFPFTSLFPAGGGDGSRGFVLTGMDGYDFNYLSVSAAGDVNADGIDDVVIGAPSANRQTYVVFGSNQGFPAIFPIASLFPAGGGDGSRGFVLAAPLGYGGWSVSTAGDVNGDAIDDLIIGAPLAEPYGLTYAGESYVVFGSNQGFPAVFPLVSLFPAGGGDGSRGFVLTGVDWYDQSAFSVSTAGDVNGDGIDDLVIGARLADPAGESSVVFGSTQGFPAIFPLASLFPAGGGDGSRGFVLGSIDGVDGAGVSVSAAGDVNGDGIDDLILGANAASPGGDQFAGESCVVFGSAQGFPALFPLASLFPAGGGDGSRGFVLPGIDADDRLGYPVSAAGDVNGDGTDDIILGAANADPGGDASAGESYVVFGSTAGFPAVVPIASLFPAGGGDGSRGFVLTGIDAYDSSGASVSAAGDVNGDGIDDLIIGADFADPDGKVSAGESYVVFGRADAP